MKTTKTPQTTQKPNQRILRYPADSADFSRSAMPLHAGLGNDANISAAHRYSMHSAMPRKVKNYNLTGFAQHVLIANDVRGKKGGKHRTRVCHRCRQYNKDCIIVALSPSPENSSASLRNLQTCGSVWACPTCAPRIASERGKEIQQALDWAKENNRVPVMVTLTARHNEAMTLEYICSRFKAAWRLFVNRRAWRRFKAEFGVEHWIAAREVLYAWHSRNGWHYHMHILLFIPRDMLRDSTGIDMESELRPDWLAALAKHDLDAIGEYGLNVAAHGDVPGKYLAKLGLNPDQPVTDARYEISGAGNKSGREGVNVWTLLEKAQHGGKDAKLAEKCYLEYVTTMQGENWITWSHGFKALVGVDETSDEQLAEADDDPVLDDWLQLSPADWYPVAQTRQYGQVLMVAAKTRSKAAVYSLIESLRDDLYEYERPEAMPPVLPAELPDSPDTDLFPWLTTGHSFAAGHLPAAGHTSPVQDRRDEIEQLVSRLSRWRANREFVRQHIKSPEIRARELATFNRLIIDGESRLETLQHEQPV